MVLWEISPNEGKQYLVFHSLSLCLPATQEEDTERFLTETVLVPMHLKTVRNTPLVPLLSSTDILPFLFSFQDEQDKKSLLVLHTFNLPVVAGQGFTLQTPK